MFVWSPKTGGRGRAASFNPGLSPADFQFKAGVFEIFPDVARVRAGLGDVIIPKSKHRNSIDPVHLLPPRTSVIFATKKRSTPVSRSLSRI